MSNIVDNAATRISFGADTVGELVIGDQLSMASAVLSVPLTLILMRIVRDVTARQAEALASGLEGPKRAPPMMFSDEPRPAPDEAG